MDDSSVETRWCYPDSNCGANYYGLEQGLKAFLHACIAHGFLCVLYIWLQHAWNKQCQPASRQEKSDLYIIAALQRQRKIYPQKEWNELLVKLRVFPAGYHIYVNQLAFPLNSAIE